MDLRILLAKVRALPKKFKIVFQKIWLKGETYTLAFFISFVGSSLHGYYTLKHSSNHTADQVGFTAYLGITLVLVLFLAILRIIRKAPEKENAVSRFFLALGIILLHLLVYVVAYFASALLFAVAMLLILIAFLAFFIYLLSSTALSGVGESYKLDNGEVVKGEGFGTFKDSSGNTYTKHLGNFFSKD